MSENQLTTGKPPPRKIKPAWASPLEGPLRRPPFERRACATCRPQGPRRRCWRRRARAALTDRACARRIWHGARATSSVDGWVSMALRLDVLEAAGARSSERRRAWADSSKRASEPEAEPPPRARWSTHFSPRTYVSLTRRLRPAVAVWPEEPGLTPAPTPSRVKEEDSRDGRPASRTRRRRTAGRRTAAPHRQPSPPPSLWWRPSLLGHVITSRASRWGGS